MADDELLNGTLSPTGGSDMSASLTFGPLHVGHNLCYAIQAVWTGTPTGTWKIQESNYTVPTSSSHWTDLVGSSVSVTGAAGDAIWSKDVATCKWVRLVWTYSSSTGAPTVYYTMKAP